MFKKFGFHMIFAFALVMVASFIGKQFVQTFTEYEKDDDYALVKKYLLNENELYGNNKPKLWIHMDYHSNSRKWDNFMSRKNDNLNQPYIYLTIQSIINHNNNDFHICIIDDNSFEKILPNWDIKLDTISEPLKTKYRNIALLKLLHEYGGIIVPNSFICMKPLISLYNHMKSEKKPFMFEKIKYIPTNTNLKPFLPHNYFMGSLKNDKMIEIMINQLNLHENHHFHNENNFQSDFEIWCLEQCNEHNVRCMDGSLIGIKNNIGKPILIDHLMGEHFLDLNDNLLYGLYIPACELLSRPKYEYFAILPKEQLIQSNCIIIKYLKSSMVDSSGKFPLAPPKQYAVSI